MTNAKFVPHSQTVFSEEELCRANPLSLSFVGDSVHTLYIRSKNFMQGRYNNGTYHFLSIKEVCAEDQAKRAEKLLPLLTEREKYIFKKATGAKFHTIPSHATRYQYSMATAVEALIGYLYLSAQNERLEELLDAVYKEEEI